jgi:hypothetical protein
MEALAHHAGAVELAALSAPANAALLRHHLAAAAELRALQAPRDLAQRREDVNRCVCGAHRGTPAGPSTTTTTTTHTHACAHSDMSASPACVSNAHTHHTTPHHTTPHHNARPPPSRSVANRPSQARGRVWLHAAPPAAAAARGRGGRRHAECVCGRDRHAHAGGARARAGGWRHARRGESPLGSEGCRGRWRVQHRGVCAAASCEGMSPRGTQPTAHCVPPSDVSCAQIMAALAASRVVPVHNPMATTPQVCSR